MKLMRIYIALIILQGHPFIGLIRQNPLNSILIPTK